MRAHKTMIYQLLPGIVLPGLIYFIVAQHASMIVALAAGLAAQAARFLEQANLLPTIVPELWDTSLFLSGASLPGQLLHVLVGYTPTPSGLQFACYVATAAGLIVASRWRSAATDRTHPRAA